MVMIELTRVPSKEVLYVNSAMIATFSKSDNDSATVVILSDGSKIRVEEKPDVIALVANR